MQAKALRADLVAGVVEKFGELRVRVDGVKAKGRCGSTQDIPASIETLSILNNRVAFRH